MSGENLVVSWQDFESSAPEIIRNLWKDDDFSDVTLASDDGKIFRAHRVILSSASSKLRNILLNHDKRENIFIYLPDINSRHLDHLLEFVYQGKCQVEQDLLEEFIICCKSLGFENLVEAFQSVDTKGNKGEQHDTSTNLLSEVPEENKKDESGGKKTESKLTEEPIVCKVCDISFSNRKCMKEHIKRKHEKTVVCTQFNCEDCSFQAQTEYVLKYHKKSVHEGVTMKCDQCEFELEFKPNCESKMKNHKDNMHGEISHKCDQCDYLTKSIQNFTKHKRNNHTKSNLVACDQCNFTKNYSEKSANIKFLEYHKKSVHEGFRWTCDICDKKFTNPIFLKSHKQRLHGQTNYKRSCNSCDFSVETTTANKSNAKLNKHMDIIHGNTVLECDQCPYTTKSSLLMKVHMSNKRIGLKLSESPLVCDKCSYTAKQKGHLDIHVRSKHNGEVFKCDLCDYNATQLSNLTRHKRAKHST